MPCHLNASGLAQRRATIGQKKEKEQRLVKFGGEENNFNRHLLYVWEREKKKKNISKRYAWYECNVISGTTADCLKLNYGTNNKQTNESI